MTSRSDPLPRHAREVWKPLQGVAVLMWPGHGSLVVDAVRGFATWQGVRLDLRRKDTVAALYSLAIGRLGRAPLAMPESVRMKTMRRELAKADLWTKMEDGRLHIVMGWDATHGAQGVAADHIGQDPDDLMDVVQPAPWYHRIEKPATRHAFHRIAKPADGLAKVTGAVRVLTDEERAQVFQLRDRGYKPIAIASITRLPYDAIAQCVTEKLKLNDRKRLAKRSVTLCHALSRKMSHNPGAVADAG